MYSLQMALINTPNQGTFYTTLLEGFENHRRSFKVEWEGLIEFMQNCCGYVQDYVSLCEYAIRRPSAECLALFDDVMTLAKALSQEAQQAESRHEKVFKELRKRRNKFSSALVSATNVQQESAVPSGILICNPPRF